jgi:hypothetical protein
MSMYAEQALPDSAQALAGAWRAGLEQAAATPASMLLPRGDIDLIFAGLAEFVAETIRAGKTLLVVVPDDEWLPELSNALDLALRPLCLVLPAASFAAGIALRATLSLLKSRLTRDVEAAWTSVWDAQRNRLEKNADVWRTALEWSLTRRDSVNWPKQVGELFPVCILPNTQLDSIAGEPRDSLLLIQPERMSIAFSQLMSHGNQILILRGAAASASRALAPADGERRLKAEFEVLAQEVGEMELEFATAQAELAEFSRHYHERVGTRIAELDALQAQIAEQLAARTPADVAIKQKAEKARAQSERSQRERTRFHELDREIEKPFAPSVELKRLFRHLAQKIHPDRAEDEGDRAWRTELMSEANRAYRASDAMVLKEILRQWQAGRDDDKRENLPEPQKKSRAHDLEQQVARMQKRLAEINEQLNRLLASRLYELFAATNMARSRNRDLLLEMAEQLDAQIAEARLKLERINAT